MNALVNISNFVEEARKPFEAVCVDRSITFEREARFATQALMAQEFTLKTAMNNPQSVINAVTNVAAIGLSLNPAKKQAYLVPRDGKICLDIGYIGLLDLAIESGSIRWGQAELVHKADRFTLNGVDKQPNHERDPFTDRGDVIGAYVVVKTRDGDYLTTCMPIAELLAIRDRSSAWKNGQKGPWKTDEGEMLKKTVIKRAYKLWPKTDRLDNAIQHLNTEGEEGLEAIQAGADATIDADQHFGLTAPRAKLLRAAASAAIEKFNVGDEMGAYEELEPFSRTNEELDAVWFVLKKHSTLRACLKRMSQEERERQSKLDAEVVEMKKAFGETGAQSAVT